MEGVAVYGYNFSVLGQISPTAGRVGEVHLHSKSFGGTLKWPFKGGSRLIEVTATAGLTVLHKKSRINTKPPQTMGAIITEPPPSNRQNPKRGLNALFWPNLSSVPDFAVVKTQLFSSHGGFLRYAMHHHRETI